MRRRLCSVFAAAIAVVGLIAGPALAGGSWFYPIEDDLQPGDTVTMVGFSGFTTGVEGEVFYGYLDVDPDTSTTAMTEETKAALLPLGPITITDGGECCWANYRLHLTFTIPADLEPGYYEFLHCNDPCTTNFGELISGEIVVGDPGDATPTGASTGLADRNYPAVAELIGQASSPDSLPVTGFDPSMFVGIAAVLLVGGTILVSGRGAWPRGSTG